MFMSTVIHHGGLEQHDEHPDRLSINTVITKTAPHEYLYIHIRPFSIDAKNSLNIDVITD